MNSTDAMKPELDMTWAEDFETVEAKPRRGRLLVALGLLGVAVAIALAMTPIRGPRTQYVTMSPRRGDLVASIAAPGTLAPVNQIEVGSEVSGLVTTVHADFNDRVEAGQLLAEIDPEPLLAQVRLSRAALLASEAALEEAKVTRAEKRLYLARQRALFERDGISQQEYDAARFGSMRAGANLKNARAQVEVKRATLAADRTRLAKAEIRAPISGIVIARRVDAGQTVVANFQTPVFFVLAEDLTRMQLHLDIDEADVGGVALGQAASFTVDAFPDREFGARISSIRLAPQTIQGVVTYETLLAVDNPDGALRPGMTALAGVVTARREDVLQVPNVALRYAPTEAQIEIGREGDAVWIATEDRLVRVVVQLGLTDGLWTEVRSGDLDLHAKLIVDAEEQR